ncbi:DUF6651 domain-containing protein [Thauera humireducens]|uniref:DUF6651 domain-containing protein n=1 Tax=Thauera humireducens TaxID=1134435 RepID=UPI00311FEE22
MKLKLDENGNVVVQDGKPVYVHDDGKEIPFDAPAALSKITALNGEAKSHRERAESAEKLAKAFEGLDASEAKKALDIVSNLDAKKLVDAGEIEKVKAEISKAFQAQLDEVSGKAKSYEQALYAEKIGGSFARSKLIAEKLAIPADLVQARFGQSFKIEDGKVVAYDMSGNKVFSRARPGELADFEEALETLIEQYPHKDHILKSSGASGGGAAGGGQSGGGKKALNRAAFDALDPAAKVEHMKSGRSVTD